MIFHPVLGVGQLALAAALIFWRARTKRFARDVPMLWYAVGGILAIDGVLQLVTAFS